MGGLGRWIFFFIVFVIATTNDVQKILIAITIGTAIIYGIGELFLPQDGNWLTRAKVKVLGIEIKLGQLILSLFITLFIAWYIWEEAVYHPPQ